MAPRPTDAVRWDPPPLLTRLPIFTQDVTFLYKLVPGVSSSSFGMNVARLAGVPAPLVASAASLADHFERALRVGMGGAGEQGRMVVEAVQRAFADAVRDGAPSRLLLGNGLGNGGGGGGAGRGGDDAAAAGAAAEDADDGLDDASLALLVLRHRLARLQAHVRRIVAAS